MKKPKNLRKCGTLKPLKKRQFKNLLDYISFLKLNATDWIKKPIKCKFAFHTFDWNEHGLNFNRSGLGGIVDFYCLKCGTCIGEMYIEDTPLSNQLHFFSLGKLAKEVQTLHDNSINESDYKSEDE